MSRFYALVAVLLLSSAAPLAVAQAPYVDLPSTSGELGLAAADGIVVSGPRVFTRDNITANWTLTTVLTGPGSESTYFGRKVDATNDRIFISSYEIASIYELINDSWQFDQTLAEAHGYCQSWDCYGTSIIDISMHSTYASISVRDFGDLYGGFSSMYSLRANGWTGSSTSFAAHKTVVNGQYAIGIEDSIEDIFVLGTGGVEQDWVVLDRTYVIGSDNESFLNWRDKLVGVLYHDVEYTR